MKDKLIDKVSDADLIAASEVKFYQHEKQEIMLLTGVRVMLRLSADEDNLFIRSAYILKDEKWAPIKRMSIVNVKENYGSINGVLNG